MSSGERQPPPELGGGSTYESLSLAVVPFALADETESPWNDGLVESADEVTALALDTLSRTGYFELIDVDRLRELRREVDKPLVGVLPHSLAKRVGDAAEVEFVVMGQVRRSAVVTWRRAGPSRTGVLAAEVEVALHVYELASQQLIYRDVARAHARARGLRPPDDPEQAPEIPAQLRFDLQSQLAQQLGERMIEALYPLRLEKVRSDGGLVLNRGRGGYLQASLVLDLLSEDGQALGQAKVEAVAARKSLARQLGQGLPLPGSILRRAGAAPLPTPEPLAVAAEPPPSPVEEGPAPARRRSGTLAYLLLGVVALLSVPLLLTLVSERRRRSQQPAATRIKVTSDTVARKRQRRDVSDWGRRLEGSEFGSTVVHETTRRPRPARDEAWTKHVQRGLQVHAASESESSGIHDPGVDMRAMAAETPAGSLSYAPQKSRFRGLVEDAWATDSALSLAPPEQSRGTEEGPQDSQANAAPSAAPSAAPRRAPDRSQASRRLDDLLG